MWCQRKPSCPLQVMLCQRGSTRLRLLPASQSTLSCACCLGGAPGFAGCLRTAGAPGAPSLLGSPPSRERSGRAPADTHAFALRRGGFLRDKPTSNTMPSSAFSPSCLRSALLRGRARSIARGFSSGACGKALREQAFATGTSRLSLDGL